MRGRSGVRGRWTAGGLAVAALLLAGVDAGAARATAAGEPTPPPGEVSVEVDARKTGREIGRLRRGVLISPKTSEYVWNKYVDEVGVKGGLVRLALDVERVNGPGDLDRQVQALDRHIQKVKAAGGEPLIFVYGVPVALSRSAAGSGQRPAGPRRFDTAPKNLTAWREMIRKAVLHFNRDKRLQIKYLEIWNEPDRREFWSGTQAEFFEVSRATIEGARSADPAIRVGGPATSSWLGAIGQQGPLIKNFLEYARRTHLPVDFISWHAFEKDPSLLRGAVREIQDWKRMFGFPDAELFLDEWNYGTPSLEREGPLGAAFAGAMMAAILASGIDRQAFAMLQDVEIAKADFGGDDWGLFTLSGIEKPAYNALRAVSMLGDLQLEVSQKGGDHFISSLAGRAEDSVGVLVTHFPPQDPLLRAGAFFFHELGYAPEDLRGWGIDDRTLKELLKPGGDAVVDRLRAPERAKTDLKQALRLYRRLDRESVEGGGRWRVRLVVRNLPSRFPVQIERYVIDGRNGNSFAARDKIAGRLAALQAEARTEALDAVEKLLRSPGSREASRGPLLALLAEVRAAQAKRAGELINEFRRKHGAAVVEDLASVEALFARAYAGRLRTGLDEINDWPEVGLVKAEATSHPGGGDVATSFHVQPYSVTLILLKRQAGGPSPDRGRP